MKHNLAQLPRYEGPYTGWAGADLGNAADWADRQAVEAADADTDAYYATVEAALAVAIDHAGPSVDDLLAVQHALVEAVRIVGETILATIDRIGREA